MVNTFQLLPCLQRTSDDSIYIMSTTDCWVDKGADLCWALGGYNLQFYSNFTLFLTLGGWSLTTILFHKSKSSENQKRFSPKNWKVFVLEIKCRPKKSPKIIQCSDANQNQIIGGMQSNYWGDILAPLWVDQISCFGTEAFCFRNICFNILLISFKNEIVTALDVW